MVRAFLALELSQEIRDRLGEAQQVFRGCSGRFTYVEPENIHITIKFLGEVEEKDLPGMQAALQKITFPPFSVNAGTVTVNNYKRPHTIWCEIDDGGQGELLLKLAEEQLAPFGFPCETRRFTPHATIARIKVPDPSLFPALRLLKGKTYGSSTINGMKLKKSTLTRQGPVYEDLYEAKW